MTEQPSGSANPEDSLSVEQRLARISGRAQAWPRWRSEGTWPAGGNGFASADDIADELIIKDIPWLMAQVRDLSQIRCECGWRGIGNHYHDKRMGSASPREVTE